MLETFNALLEACFLAWQENASILIGGLFVLWAIHGVNVLFGYRLCVLGIHPRRWYGLPGLIFSPLLHGSTNHLFMNTIPGGVLASLVVLNGQETLLGVTLFIALSSGLCVWLFGRHAIHIGASGLVMGYWGYLLVAAIHHPTTLTILMGMLCFYYFTEMASNLVPEHATTSWEGHVFGFLSGVVAAFILPGAALLGSG